MAQNGTRCRPLYEARDARISILARQKPETGYVDADWSDRLDKAACRRGGPYVCTAGRAMGFHDRAVDQIKIVVRFRRQRVENPLPDPASRPPVEAIVSRRIGPIPLGQITPRHPRAQHVEYRVHYPSIVHPATLPTARHERLQQSPLLVTQIKPHDPPPITV